MANVRLKGKEWYDIVTPEMFGSETIGQTPAKDDEDVIDRTIEVGVPDLTDDRDKYYLKVKLQVDSVKDNGKALTKFQELQTQTDYISRMVRRRVRRIDSNVKARTKDDVLIRVKSIGISIRRINTSIKTSVRKTMDEVIEDYITKHNLDEVVMGIINDKPQGAVKNQASKKYPLKAVEVRKVEVMDYPNKE